MRRLVLVAHVVGVQRDGAQSGLGGTFVRQK